MQPPLRICNYPGCKKLTRSSYCPEHTHEVKQARRREYDQRRGSSSQRGYDAIWQKLRKLVIHNHPACQQCGSEKNLMVHHIKPIEAGGNPLDEDNCMVLCRDCHERLHGRKG